MNLYEQSFIEKCAEYGVDPEALIKEALKLDSRVVDYLTQALVPAPGIGHAAVGAVRGEGGQDKAERALLGLLGGTGGAVLGGAGGAGVGGGIGAGIGALIAKLKGGDVEKGVRTGGTIGGMTGAGIGGVIGGAEGGRHFTTKKDKKDDKKGKKDDKKDDKKKKKKDEDDEKEASAYEIGFVEKCAEFNVDPEALLRLIS